MRVLILSMLLWLPLSGAQAEDLQLEPLTAAEISALLSSNTAIGDWNGTPYRQYFAANGETVYAQRGTRSTLGKWRVNSQTDTYESWWERSGWSSYRMARDEDRLFWISESLPPQAFSMLPGEQLLK